MQLLVHWLLETSWPLARFATQSRKDVPFT